MKDQHLSRGLEEILEEEGLLAHAEEVATKRVLAFQIAELMRQQELSKTELARRMDSSRAAVDRLLDPDRGSATRATLEKAARWRWVPGCKCRSSRSA